MFSFPISARRKENARKIERRVVIFLHEIFISAVDNVISMPYKRGGRKAGCHCIHFHGKTVDPAQSGIFNAVRGKDKRDAFTSTDLSDIY